MRPTAIETALDEAPDGSLVVILPESVTRSINLINARNPLPDPHLAETVHAAEEKATVDVKSSDSSVDLAPDQYAKASL
jgi:cyanophycin synthetase